MQQNLSPMLRFMVIFAVLCCIYFNYDIDTPFPGYVAVKSDVFQQIRAKMLALQ